MALTSGSRLGVFEIIGELGAGGMGQVYRARDTKLNRDIALKVLPESLTHDLARVSRFRREAQVLASLNHSHIGSIYGFEEANGVSALVLELVDGPTLADRIARGPLPLDVALPIAKQIAEALEAAHAQGVVHRDLKPANIKVRPDGTVKVLDFGLAKAMAPPDSSGAVSEVPTLTSPVMTRAGAVLGTAAYMSPEQARGQAVDSRADVWAFGAVMFEMLTGRRAFAGVSSSDTLAAVLQHEPDWTGLPSAVPDDMRRLLQLCLQKDQANRLRDIGDVRLLIDNVIGTTPSAPHGTQVARSSVRWPWVAGAAIILVALGALASYLWRSPAPSMETVRMSMAAPGPITPQLSGIISPDGHFVAFVATGSSGKSMLWVRPLDSLEAHEVPGTERAAHPFWSPNGKSIGFIADAKVKTVALPGGPVQTVADAPSPFRAGAAWNREGVILFTPRADQIAMVPAAGGPVSIVLTADRSKRQTALRWPEFLPDDRHFLYFAEGERPEFRGVYVGSLDSKDSTLVLNSDIKARYAAPGYLLFLRNETLMAQPFDSRRLELSGKPMAIADGVWFARSANHASFSVSRTGALAYVNASEWNRQLIWFDRSGRELGPTGAVERDANLNPQLSPDGHRIAVGRGEWQRGNIWILDVSRGTRSRVTFSAEGDGVPHWSADGRRILFQSGPRVIVKDLESGSEDRLLESAVDRVADWSRDGRFLVLQRGPDLWAVDLAGDRHPFPLLESSINKAQAQLSPNGKWIAYTSNETGRDEVYVETFPRAGAKRQVSVDGGAMPRWRRDGSEMFYVALNQFLMAVPVNGAGTGAFQPAAPVPLFRTRIVVQGSESVGFPTSYDATADGQRFLLDGMPEVPEPPMTLVLNWMGTLKK